MTIDQATSPASAEFERKHQRFLRDVPGLRPLLESIADLEKIALDARARLKIHENLLLQLDRAIPRTIERDLLSHIEARQKVVGVMQLVVEAQNALAEVR